MFGSKEFFRFGNITFLLVLAVWSLLTSGMANGDCTAGPDAAEPNDNVATAFPVVCNTSNTPNPVCVDSSNDVDFYSFTVDASDPVICIGVDTFGMGSSLNAEMTLYDTDGVTVLKSNLDCLNSNPVIQDWMSSPGTYYFSVQSQDGSIGDYKLTVSCYLPDSGQTVAAFGNNLKIVKESADSVLLASDFSCWPTMPPPTHFNIFRATSTTAFTYDQIAEVQDTGQSLTYSANIPDPLEPIYYFQVQSENPNGTGDPYPAFADLFIEPSPEVTFDINQPISANACDRPNLNTTLPLDLRVVLLDRFGGAVDGVSVRIVNLPWAFPTLGTFCPEGADSAIETTVVTGTDGPGTAVFPFTIHESERTLCLQYPDDCINLMWAESVYATSDWIWIKAAQ